MTLHIRLLGPPQISRDDEPIEIPGYRPLALLAYLLVTKKAHSRQHLVDLLFEGPSDPRAALRWNLSKLRGAIGADCVLADRSEVAFDFESDYSLDVTALEAGQADVYQGDFLEGLHIRDAYRFEDWAFFERERLRGCYQDALARQIEECDDRGDDPRVVEIAHQLLRLDNLREDWYRALMRAYARLGKREAALAQYAQCRQVLEAELGVEPVEETAALAETIEAGYLQLERRQGRAARPVAPPIPKAAPWPRFPTSLVGRAAQLTTLRQAWKRAGEGVGQLVLVEGEPGIGKTRLIEELLAEVSDQAVILRAKCPDVEQPLAYTLFVDPLRQTMAPDPPPNLGQAWLAELARLLPELCDRYPDLPQPVEMDPADQRRRLFDAVCATLTSLAEAEPLVLFLDDLQWADATSLELLTHFTSRMAEAPVLILGAYRPEEIEARHPLRRARHEWERRGWLTRLPLEALPEAGVNDLLRELTGGQGPNGAFGAFIYRETGGNPLFVVETLASLRDEGRLASLRSGAEWVDGKGLAIPAGVQAVIQTRLGRLDELSRQVLTAAAVMRGDFPAEVVQAVSGRSELETLESLEQLLARGLLIEAGQNRFTFSHDKIREVAYEGLSQLRCQLLHRRLAETLERRHRGRKKGVAERLAYHYEKAGISDKALEYHLQAGHSAREQYAHEAAVGHYQKALAYLKERKDYERAARTLMQLGLTYHTAFDFKRARQAYQEGFALWQQAVEREPTVPPPAAPHALRLLWENPPSLDPSVSAEAHSSNLIRQLFSGLVELSPNMEVIPDVAHSWEVPARGRRYVFHLRDDVRWSDGIRMTAGDFEYAWKRALDPATGSAAASLLYDVKGARAFHQAEGSRKDVGVYALDDVTLAVELEEPTPYFLHLLDYPATYPVPRHVVEAHGEAWSQLGTIVTNGPFHLAARQPRGSMVLARNPEYHGRFAGNVERVELFLAADRSRELEMYKDGKTDAFGLAALPSDGLYRARQRNPGEYVTAPHMAVGYVTFDVRRPPFNDPRVRRAFVLATDRETLADVVLRGHDSPADGGFVLPWMPGHSAGIGWPYDPDAARQSLAEAGYVRPEDFPPVEILAFRGWETTIEYLAAGWHTNLEIEISWQTPERPIYEERLNREPPHMYWGVWMAEYPDPDNYLRVAVSGIQRVTGWRDEDYDRLVEEARRAMDQKDRMKLYQQADKILIEQAAIMPLLYGRANYLVKPWVRGYLLSPVGEALWKDVIIDSH